MKKIFFLLVSILIFNLGTPSTCFAESEFQLECKAHHKLSRSKKYEPTSQQVIFKYLFHAARKRGVDLGAMNFGWQKCTRVYQWLKKTKYLDLSVDFVEDIDSNQQLEQYYSEKRKKLSVIAKDYENVISQKEQELQEIPENEKDRRDKLSKEINSLKEIYSEVTHRTNIVALDKIKKLLAYPRIQSLHQLREFTHFKGIDLSHQKINSDRLRVVTSNDLEYLSLSYTFERDAFSSAESFQNLKYLYISGPKSNDFIPNLSFTKLEFIDVSKTGVKNIDNLFSIRSLKRIIASENEIKHIDLRELDKMQNLEYLDLEKNEIKNFQLVANRAKLLTVNLKENKLEIEPIRINNVRPLPDENVPKRLDIQEKLSNQSLIGSWKSEAILIGQKGSVKDDIVKSSNFETLQYALWGASSVCNLDNFEAIRRVLKGYDKRELYSFRLEENGSTPLIAAVKYYPAANDSEKNRCTRIINRILKGRSSLAYDRDADNFTALHYAVNTRSATNIRLLLNHNYPDNILEEIKNLPDTPKEVKELISGTLDIIDEYDVPHGDLTSLAENHIKELTSKGFSPESSNFIRALCTKIEHLETCNSLLQASLLNTKITQIGFQDLILKLETNPYLKDRYDSLKKMGEVHINLYKELQALFLNYFSAIHLSREGIMALESQKPSWKEAIAGFSTQLSFALGSITAGITYPIGVGLMIATDEFKKQRKKSEFNEQSKKSKFVGNHLDDAGRFATELAYELTKEFYDAGTVNDFYGELDDDNYRVYAIICKQMFKFSLFEQIKVTARLLIIKELAHRIHKLVTIFDPEKNGTILKWLEDKIESNLNSESISEKTRTFLNAIKARNIRKMIEEIQQNLSEKPNSDFNLRIGSFTL